MKKTFARPHPEGSFLITISTDGCGGRPYFSITADLKYKGGGSCCGCMHKDVLKVAPEFKPFVDLHLSNLDGIPMHAEENGFYWLAKAAGIPQEYGPDQDEETCFTYLYEHLRTGYDETKLIVEATKAIYSEGKKKIAIPEEVSQKCREMQEAQGVFDAKAFFKKTIEGMKERWKGEAESAISLLEKL